jgi:type VI secretion system protein ImpB
MPIVKIVRSGVKASVRPAPTSTTLVVQPMTFDRVGKEVPTADSSENQEAPKVVHSIADAFEEFKPELHFADEVDGTGFVVDLGLRSIGDMDPKTILKKRDKAADGSLKKNDAADLQSTIDLLYRVKTMWSRVGVERAWADEKRRAEIIEALGRMKSEVARIAKAGPKGKGNS